MLRAVSPVELTHDSCYIAAHPVFLVADGKSSVCTVATALSCSQLA